MKEFDWNGLDEISGFGGSYEKCCRKLVKVGVKYLRELNVKMDSIDCDVISKLKDRMDKATGCEATGAMLGTAANHALFIYRNGWNNYAKRMKERK